VWIDNLRYNRGRKWSVTAVSHNNNMTSALRPESRCRFVRTINCDAKMWNAYERPSKLWRRVWWFVHPIKLRDIDFETAAFISLSDIILWSSSPVCGPVNRTANNLYIIRNHVRRRRRERLLLATVSPAAIRVSVDRIDIIFRFLPSAADTN